MAMSKKYSMSHAHASSAISGSLPPFDAQTASANRLMALVLSCEAFNFSCFRLRGLGMAAGLVRTPGTAAGAWFWKGKHGITNDKECANASLRPLRGDTY